MQLETYFAQARSALAGIPFLSRIETQETYKQALAAMDSLLEDYEANATLIDILARSIEDWEENSSEFAIFNAEISKMNGVDLLKLLIEQHQLDIADLPELGSKDNVSKILNSADGEALTLKHIQALSRRFNLPPAWFV